jgi:iron complex transport system permease protein
LGLGALTLFTFILTVGWGTHFLSPAQVMVELMKGPMAEPTAHHSIVWEIRLVRACGCALVGGILGVVGSAFQALFRNPLAEPYVVGVSSGAAVGGVLAIVLGIGSLGQGLALIGLAFLSGLLSLGIVFLLARRRGAVDITSLLLSGVVIGSLLSALTSMLLLVGGQDANQVLRWLLGSTTPMHWSRVGILTVVAVLGSAILTGQTRALNAFAIGEETARRLGVDTSRLKAVVLIAGTAMTAVAVGTVGVIGFLGLVAPHLSRQLYGVDFRRSLLGSFLIGSGLLLASDIVAQRGMEWAAQMFSQHGAVATEIPVGIVTSLLGAPFLLILLRRDRGE